MLRRIQVALAIAVFSAFFAGCASLQASKLAVSCRLIEVDNGVSVYQVVINGKKMEFRNPVGGVSFFENKEKNILRVRVDSEDSRGTYVGGEIDHYYYIGNKGQVTYLGNLKASWYENENLIRVKTDEFEPLVVPEKQ